jgi:Cysteine-rich secretory protein family
MSLVRPLLILLALLAFPARAEAPGSFAAKVLASHNDERTRLGIAPLAWNPQLAAQARDWARNLAARGVLRHSRNAGGTGENLWMGTSGAFPPEAMIGAFVGERKHFQAGRFPAVSRTGRWSDVGHYTQLIWPATREVGCALVAGRDRDVLVCRYYPAGNIIGQRVP